MEIVYKYIMIHTIRLKHLRKRWKKYFYINHWEIVLSMVLLLLFHLYRGYLWYWYKNYDLKQLMKSSFSICSNNFGLEKLLFCTSPKDKTYKNGTIITAAEICGETPFEKLHQIRIKWNFSLLFPIWRLIIFCYCQ